MITGFNSHQKMTFAIHPASSASAALSSKRNKSNATGRKHASSSKCQSHNKTSPSNKALHEKLQTLQSPSGNSFEGGICPLVNQRNLDVKVHKDGTMSEGPSSSATSRQKLGFGKIGKVDLEETSSFVAAWQILRRLHQADPYTRAMLQSLSSKHPGVPRWTVEIDEAVRRGIIRGNRTFNSLCHISSGVHERFIHRKLLQTISLVILNKYVVLDRLSTGAVGHVHFGFEKSTGRPVAVKIMDLFRREATAEEKTTPTPVPKPADSFSTTCSSLSTAQCRKTVTSRFNECGDSRQGKEDGGEAVGERKECAKGGGGDKHSQRLQDDLKIREELEIAMSVKHANIVSTLAVAQCCDKLVQVLQYCDAGDLVSFIRQSHHLEEPNAQYLFRQMVEGLSYLHHEGIVHRDLKPENILLTHRALPAEERRLLRLGKRPSASALDLKLADFGAAIHWRPGQLFYDTVGTLSYAAPEVLNANSSSKGYEGPPSDVWSLGVVVYAMLYGSLPWNNQEKPIEEAYQNIIKNTLSLPIQSPFRVSKDARSLLLSMLNVDASKRITLQEIKGHPWVTETLPFKSSPTSSLQKFCRAYAASFASSSLRLPPNTTTVFPQQLRLPPQLTALAVPSPIPLNALSNLALHSTALKSPPSLLALPSPPPARNETTNSSDKEVAGNEAEGTQNSTTKRLLATSPIMDATANGSVSEGKMPALALSSSSSSSYTNDFLSLYHPQCQSNSYQQQQHLPRTSHPRHWLPALNIKRFDTRDEVNLDLSSSPVLRIGKEKSLEQTSMTERILSHTSSPSLSPPSSVSSTTLLSTSTAKSPTATTPSGLSDLVGDLPFPAATLSSVTRPSAAPYLSPKSPTKNLKEFMFYGTPLPDSLSPAPLPNRRVKDNIEVAHDPPSSEQSLFATAGSASSVFFEDCTSSCTKVGRTEAESERISGANSTPSSAVPSPRLCLSVSGHNSLSILSSSAATFSSSLFSNVFGSASVAMSISSAATTCESYAAKSSPRISIAFPCVTLPASSVAPAVHPKTISALFCTTAEASTSLSVSVSSAASSLSSLPPREHSSRRSNESSSRSSILISDRSCSRKYDNVDRVVASNTATARTRKAFSSFAQQSPTNSNIEKSSIGGNNKSGCHDTCSLKSSHSCGSSDFNKTLNDNDNHNTNSIWTSREGNHNTPNTNYSSSRRTNDISSRAQAGSGIPLDMEGSYSFASSPSSTMRKSSCFQSFPMTLFPSNLHQTATSSAIHSSSPTSPPFRSFPCHLAVRQKMATAMETNPNDGRRRQSPFPALANKYTHSTTDKKVTVDSNPSSSAANTHGKSTSTRLLSSPNIPSVFSPSLPFTTVPRNATFWSPSVSHQPPQLPQISKLHESLVAYRNLSAPQSVSCKIIPLHSSSTAKTFTNGSSGVAVAANLNGHSQSPRSDATLRPSSCVPSNNRASSFFVATQSPCSSPSMVHPNLAVMHPAAHRSPVSPSSMLSPSWASSEKQKQLVSPPVPGAAFYTQCLPKVAASAHFSHPNSSSMEMGTPFSPHVHSQPNSARTIPFRSSAAAFATPFSSQLQPSMSKRSFISSSTVPLTLYPPIGLVSVPMLSPLLGRWSTGNARL